MAPLDESEASTEPAAAASESPKRTRRSRFGMLGFVLAVAVLGLGIYVEIRDRGTAEASLAQSTEESAVDIVSTVNPDAGAPTEEIVLPGNTQPYTDTPIYARTSGYLKSWHFDIGARVKQGDLLAEIETPEVDAQLMQARADLATAVANLKLADITARRNEQLLKTGYGTTQTRDDTAAAFDADRAIVASRQAEMARLEQLQSYEKVYAPFDGIITARNTDVGSLIDAGANSAQRELFHLAAIDRIRVFVQVPEIYSRGVRPGMPAVVTLDEFPGEKFSGLLARTDSAIDPVSRTLLIEVDVDNADGRLLPGAYAFVHLGLPKEARSVTVPSNTLIFRKDGLRVAVVRNGHAQLVPITIGRDYGNKVEVVSGLTTADAVILDPSDSLIEGTPVRVAPAKASRGG